MSTEQIKYIKKTPNLNLLDYIENLKKEKINLDQNANNEDVENLNF